MADLLFPIIPPQIHRRKFRHNEICLEDYSDEELRRRYRFGRDSLKFLTEIFQNDLQRDTKRNQALSPTLQVLVALRFFASGSFLQVISDTVGLPKSSVLRVVSNASLALATKQREFISWPSPLEIQEVKRGFYDKGGFPGVIGCLDGTHVRIQAPSANESDYVDRKGFFFFFYLNIFSIVCPKAPRLIKGAYKKRKGFHSINVQAVCNHKGRYSKCDKLLLFLFGFN